VQEQRVRQDDLLFALMVTDVLEGDTTLLVSGPDQVVQRAFGKRPDDGRVDLPGVMSRKKQVAPELLRAAATEG